MTPTPPPQSEIRGDAPAVGVDGWCKAGRSSVKRLTAGVVDDATEPATQAAGRRKPPKLPTTVQRPWGGEDPPTSRGRSGQPSRPHQVGQLAHGQHPGPDGTGRDGTGRDGAGRLTTIARPNDTAGVAGPGEHLSKQPAAARLSPARRRGRGVAVGSWGQVLSPAGPKKNDTPAAGRHAARSHRQANVVQRMSWSKCRAATASQ